jgi:tetratricopeptide (TPR) repeat protein
LKRGNPFIIFTILGCAIGLLLALIHSLFDFIFHTPAVSLLFFIIMGIAFRGVYIDSSKEDVSCGFLRLGAAPTIKRITAILSVFIFIGTGLLVINRYRADSIFNKIKDQKVKAKGVDAIVEYRKICRRIDESISLNPLDSTYYYKKANIFAQLAVNDKIAVDLINIDEFGDKNSLLSNSEKLYTQAILLNPTKADYHLQLGWVYRIKGDKQYSDDEFNKAILLDPTNNGLRRYVEKYRLD